MTAIGRNRPAAAFDLVVIVASLGGLQSASTVLAGLPADFPVPIILLQHGMAGGATDALAPLLQRRASVPVHTTRSSELLAGAGVRVLPPGSTAQLDAGHRLSLLPADRGGGGDALLASAAALAGPRLIGIVLTGMLRDGTDGVRAVKRHGGRVFVEDPQTARAASMPANAIATGCVDFALPKERLAPALVALTLAPGGAALFAVPMPAWASLGA